MRTRSSRIQLGHGGGGKMTSALVRKTIFSALDRGFLAAAPDSVTLTGLGDRIAFTTDSYVVSPIFFPGGDIGSLAVHGTCNDLACSGARPRYLSLGLILEEGLPMDELEAVLKSISMAADEAGVQVVTGDTKVVPKGGADKIFVNTSGIGVVETDFIPAASRVQPGDIVLVSGPVGNHGMTVMLTRAEFSFDFEIKSDSASVWPLVERLLTLGPDLRFLRDPTRGGIAATLNELAQASGKGVLVHETAIPIDEGVRAASEILGIDPLQAANEGKLVAVIARERADEALRLIADCPPAQGPALIGEVVDTHHAKVVMRTALGGTRALAEPSGELLPRIC